MCLQEMLHEISKLYLCLAGKWSELKLGKRKGEMQELCQELCTDPPTEDCIQCSVCATWWHEACTAYETVIKGKKRTCPIVNELTPTLKRTCPSTGARS